MRSQEDIQLIKALQFTVESLQANFDALMKEYDAAHAEVEQLKQALHDARLENSGQAARIERTVNQSLTVRKEPSRLEIAALLMAHSWPHDGVYNIICQKALEQADALIAAAKEGK
jgi:hypothetical protein